MMPEREGGLLEWQYREYAEHHRDKLNLWIHFYTVPAFMAGTAATLANLLTWNAAGLAFSLLFVIFAVVLQIAGHWREVRTAEPFAGWSDFVRRSLAEQFVTFPRFVLSGGWVRNLTRRREHH